MSHGYSEQRGWLGAGHEKPDRAVCRWLASPLLEAGDRKDYNVVRRSPASAVYALQFLILLLFKLRLLLLLRGFLRGFLNVLSGIM